MEIIFGSAIASLLFTENPQIMVAIAGGLSAIFGGAVVAFTIRRKSKEKGSVVVKKQQVNA
jgi:membrane associated rhomboid family serine protease